MLMLSELFDKMTGFRSKENSADTSISTFVVLFHVQASEGRKKWMDKSFCQSSVPIKILADKTLISGQQILQKLHLG